MPGNVNYQANIWALKEEGCTHILVTTACGSLQENIHPGDIVVLDQFIDRYNLVVFQTFTTQIQLLTMIFLKRPF